jgi:hypothetical protein
LSVALTSSNTSLIATIINAITALRSGPSLAFSIISSCATKHETKKGRNKQKNLADLGLHGLAEGKKESGGKDGGEVLRVHFALTAVFVERAQHANCKGEDPQVV